MCIRDSKYTPECFIVGNVINGDGNVNKLSLLSRIKVNSSKRFQTTLKAVFDRFRPDMVVSRTERNELELARKIRQSQEEAYQNSLRKDQIKEQEKTIIREEKRLQELEEKMKKIKETYGKLKWLNECLLILEGDKNDLLNSSSHSTEVKMATLQIRTAQGKRLIKKFDSQTTLHDIYINIGCHLFLNNHSLDIKEWSESIVDKIKELSEDGDVLCFADRDIVEEELISDTAEIKPIIQEELMKWETEMNSINEDLSLIHI